MLDFYVPSIAAVKITVFTFSLTQYKRNASRIKYVKSCGLPYDMLWHPDWKSTSPSYSLLMHTDGVSEVCFLLMCSLISAKISTRC